MKRLCIALFLVIIFPSLAWSACSTSWSRSKDWGDSEVLTADDLEAEFDRGYTFGSDCMGGGLDWDDAWADAVHSHVSDAEGSQLDWDNIWTDAVHAHSSNAEGGTVQAHASTVAESITVGLVSTEAGASGKSMIVDGDGGASWGTPLVDEIKDSDGDTKVQAEESNNENKIRFDTGGVERAILDSSGLQMAVAAAATPQTNTLVKENIVKAWVNFAGSITINADYNIASITDNTVGDFTITIAQDMADTNYVVVGGGLEESGGDPLVVNIKEGTSLAVGSFTIITQNQASTPADVNPTMVMVIGNQ